MPRVLSVVDISMGMGPGTGNKPPRAYKLTTAKQQPFLKINLAIIIIVL